MKDFSIYKTLDESRNNFILKAHIKSVLIMGDPKDCVYISFVIPTYKRVDTLKKTIESILTQNISFSFNIIVIDNSADFSEENVTFNYLKKLDNNKIIYYINKENLGQAGNWNRGFELANCKYVSFIHDDDILHKDYAREIVKCISVAERQTKELGIIRVNFEDFYDDTKIPSPGNKNRGGIRRFTEIESLMITGIGPAPCPTCGTIFNKEVVIRLGGFDERFYPSFDYIMGYLILINDYAVYYTEDVLGFYRKGVNEAKNNLINFSESDYYFRQFLYSRNYVAKIWAVLFSNLQFYSSICALRAYAKSLGIEISEDEIANGKPYRTSRLRLKLFVFFQRVIQFINKRVYYQ